MEIVVITLLPFFIFIDQASKYIIRLRQPAEGGFYICNPNMAFGIPISPLLFWIFWTGIICSILFNIRKFYMVEEQIQSQKDAHDSCFLIHNSYKIVALILILSGAVSNIIDRVFFGCVIDFINLKIWPVFNLADAFIVAGAVILLAKGRKMW